MAPYYSCMKNPPYKSSQNERPPAKCASHPHIPNHKMSLPQNFPATTSPKPQNVPATKVVKLRVFVRVNQHLPTTNPNYMFM